ncbi:MAG: HAD family acid phosphatase [Anaerolineales bacterium]|nr:HAD family acid phosphatase [Anaerolineales bacterium]
MEWNRLRSLIFSAAICAVFSSPAQSQPAPNDGLNAALWTQTSVEFKGNARGMYRLAEIMLDRALADKKWTAAPIVQGRKFKKKPPAVMLDVDETVLDNSAYAAWLVATGGHYSSKTWISFVRAEQSLAVPGSLEFIRYARKKGVQVFYVTNRKAPQEEATRNNLKALGYPIDDSEDTVLLKGEKKDWSSAKGTRKAVITENYRLVLVVGDNFSDFVDDYKGTLAERQAVSDKYSDYWGTRWIVIANPIYGSFESSLFGGNYKLTGGERRALKIKAMAPWVPKGS